MRNSSKMRILIHDFVGHPFIFQLSKEFARRGHTVLHVYFADFDGPKALFDVVPELRAHLTVEAVRTGGMKKYSMFSRLAGHRRYARRVKRLIASFRPEFMISGQSPTDVERTLLRAASSVGAVFVHWVQDFYSVAMESAFVKKFGPAGRFLAWPFHVIERTNFRLSDWVVYITDDFSTYARNNGFFPRREAVVENWAPIEEIPILAKDNSWSRKTGLDSRFVFLYSGTMGLKHNPEALIALAEKFRSDPDVAIVLVSEGLGRQYLEEQKRLRGLENLYLFDFQPFSEVPSVLASADVVITTLEADSSIFCAPSKVLSYCCAGRAQLVLAPSANLITRMISKSAAGFAFEPDNLGGFLQAAATLREDTDLSERLGRNARRYAEITFNVARIADRFTEMAAPSSI